MMSNLKMFIAALLHCLEWNKENNVRTTFLLDRIQSIQMPLHGQMTLKEKEILTTTCQDGWMDQSLRKQYDGDSYTQLKICFQTFCTE